MRVGQRMRKIRISKGILLKHMSEKLGYSNSSGYLSIEQGKARLDADKIPIVLEVLGVTYNELFFDEKLREAQIIDQQFHREG